MDVSDSDSDEEGQVCTSNECIVLFISFARLKWSGILCWGLFHLWQCNPGSKEEKVQCWRCLQGGSKSGKQSTHKFQAAREAGAEEVAPGAPGGAGGSGGTRC